MTGLEEASRHGLKRRVTLQEMPVGSRPYYLTTTGAASGGGGGDYPAAFTA